MGYTQMLNTNSTWRIAVCVGEGCGRMALAEGASVHHISRGSPDVKRLANFYQEVLGFQRVETPVFQGMEVIWLRLRGSPLTLHLIERDTHAVLPEGPHGTPGEAGFAGTRALPRGHHICFAVSNYDDFVRSLKERGVETFEKTQPDGKTKQVFFFDPDGNGLEVGSWAS